MKTKSLSTPLHYFCFRDLRKWNLEDIFYCLHLLSSSKEDNTNAQTIRGETPLHYLLLGSESVIVFFFLLLHGAGMETLDQFGTSPMMMLSGKNSALLDALKEYTNWKKANKSSSSSFQSQLKEGRKECRSLSKWGVKVHDERSIPQYIDECSGSAKIQIADDAIFGDFCPVNPKEATTGRFSFDQQLYRLACSYSILSSPPLPGPFAISPHSMGIGGKEDFLDCVYYPGWSDVVVRGLLLIHGKYYHTTDLLKKLVSDSKKYTFLLRVLDIWIKEHFDSSLRKHESCLQSLKRLLQFLEEKLPNVSILEKRLLDCLKEVTKEN